MSSRFARAAIVLFLLAAAQDLCAANPFLGRYAMETFGQTEELIFEFLDDTTMVVATGQETSPRQSYALDENLGLLTLPMSEGGDVVLRYMWITRDTFALFMSEALLDQMAEVFTSSLPRGANDLTDEIVERLRVVVRDVFATSPFMRGTRIQ
jgi:hypothetical protein